MSAPRRGRAPLLTPAEYAARGGAACPWCESTDIEAVGGMEFDGPDAWSDMGCNGCGSRWSDTYRLTGYAVEG